MYKIEDLFDKRSVVGSKMELILKEKGYTKAELCKDIEISRPTLNKLLAGTLTSKINYEKHIEKMLKYLGITPDQLLGKASNSNQRIRQIRNMMRIATEDVTRVTGISLKRLQQIEAGADVSLAELRDIALCLNVSVRSLLGENIFESQVASLDYFTQGNKVKETNDLSGFWGHIGVLLSNTDRYLWYPITGSVRSDIYKMIDNERVVVPCMNNRILYLYMPNVKEVVLLDEACGTPNFANWDPEVSEGEIPLVVYEALEDYIYDDADKIGDENLSVKFKEFLKKLIIQKHWDENAIFDLVDNSTIYYADGKTRMVYIQFDKDDSISAEISCVYTFEDMDRTEHMLFFTAEDEVVNFLNIEHISMLELPLLKVEESVADSYREMDEL